MSNSHLPFRLILPKAFDLAWLARDWRRLERARQAVADLLADDESMVLL